MLLLGVSCMFRGISSRYAGSRFDPSHTFCVYFIRASFASFQERPWFCRSQSVVRELSFSEKYELTWHSRSNKNDVFCHQNRPVAILAEALVCSPKPLMRSNRVICPKKNDNSSTC